MTKVMMTSMMMVSMMMKVTKKWTSKAFVSFDVGEVAVVALLLQLLCDALPC
jgi:hypothetical protein